MRVGDDIQNAKPLRPHAGRVEKSRAVVGAHIRRTHDDLDVGRELSSGRVLQYMIHVLQIEDVAR